MIFCVRQLQEKCKEQNVPLFIAFVDLTKAFNLVSRERMFAILLKIGCPPSLFTIVKAFHTNTKATIQCDGNVSELFKIKSGVKQGCVLAPTLFGIFFFMLLKRAFCSSTVEVKLNTRSVYLVYLGYSIASNASMDTEINCRIGKASGTFSRLSGRVWDNPKLTIRTKSDVYRACVCNTLLWTLSTMQEKKVNTFHQRCLRRILRIKWQHKITKEDILRRTGLTTIYTTLSQRRLR